jgi:hypothetical protein
MTSNIIFTLLKYLMIVIFLIIVFKFVPSQNISNTDIIILIIIVFLIFIAFDVFTRLLIRDNFESCSNNNQSVLPQKIDNNPEQNYINDYPEQKLAKTNDELLKINYSFDDYNHVPMGDGINTGNFEYGFSYLPPDKWYPQPAFPPICVTNRNSYVLPSNTTGVPLNVKEWH